MRIIKPTTVRGWMTRHAGARRALERWLEVARAAQWEDLLDVRTAFRSADPVVVESGRTVYVFNIGGNRFRLIAAIHFNTGRVYTLRLLTHAEYDKESWKDEL